MLILGRRIGESLVIGDNDTVTVLGVMNNQVRLGIDAPKDVTVHRREILRSDSRARFGWVDLASGIRRCRPRMGGESEGFVEAAPWKMVPPKAASAFAATSPATAP